MKNNLTNISDEVIAAFLDGNATVEETKAILALANEDADLRELLYISRLVDEDLGKYANECEYLPMMAVAASCNEGAYCSLECEKYIMESFSISFDHEKLMNDAIMNGWTKENGTALHNVGRHLEKAGLLVTRRYKSSMDDIAKALTDGERVIVAIDGGELTGDRVDEINEDTYIGQIPDHTVVVLSVDKNNDKVKIYDPNSIDSEDDYSIGNFVDAWNDSKNYLVTVTTKIMESYNPTPIDLSDVVLSDELNELREAIAENAHDVWAIERKAQGWTYGPQRDDIKKETPCMVAYSLLPDSEKKFDRDMAMNTLKLFKKLGYDLIRREDTELYKVLKKRIQTSEEDFFCRQCGNPIYKHQVFCDKCGLLLDMDWE